MKLSILIPVYNLEKFVSCTLESVLRQNIKYEYEIIVGDDGSIDNTVQIIEQYEKQWPGLIRHFVMPRDNMIKYDRIERSSKNRLNLLKEAKGEYIIYLDGDDFFTDDNKLQIQIEELDKKENKNCIAVAHEAEYFWSENKRKVINGFNKQATIPGKLYWKYSLYFCSNSIMFRNISDYILNNPIFEKHFDDNLITFALLQFGDILYLPQNMVAYRQTEGSTWNSTSKLEKNYINLMDLDIEGKISPNFKRESKYRHVYNKLMVFMYRKEQTEELRNKYLEIAKEEELTNFYQWVQINYLPRLKKLKLEVSLMSELLEYSYIFVKRELYIRKYLKNDIL